MGQKQHWTRSFLRKTFPKCSSATGYGPESNAETVLIVEAKLVADFKVEGRHVNLFTDSEYEVLAAGQSVIASELTLEYDRTFACSLKVKSQSNGCKSAKTALVAIRQAD